MENMNARVQEILAMLEDNYGQWNKVRAKRLGRSPFHVADRLFREIPDNHPRKAEYEVEFTRFIEKSSYKAPELYASWVWPELGRLCYKVVPNPSEEWEKRFVKIYNAENVVDKDKLEYWARS